MLGEGLQRFMDHNSERKMENHIFGSFEIRRAKEKRKEKMNIIEKKGEHPLIQMFEAGCGCNNIEVLCAIVCQMANIYVRHCTMLERYFMFYYELLVAL